MREGRLSGNKEGEEEEREEGFHDWPGLTGLKPLEKAITQRYAEVTQRFTEILKN
jgi:hypothetical protein